MKMFLSLCISTGLGILCIRDWHKWPNIFMSLVCSSLLVVGSRAHSKSRMTPSWALSLTILTKTLLLNKVTCSDSERMWMFEGHGLTHHGMFVPYRALLVWLLMCMPPFYACQLWNNSTVGVLSHITDTLIILLQFIARTCTQGSESRFQGLLSLWYTLLGSSSGILCHSQLNTIDIPFW